MSGDVTIKYRPLVQWTDPVSEPLPSPFTASWSATLALLRREVYAISASNYPDVVIQLDVSERSVRTDGSLRADAKVRSHGVVISFESTHGPLRYACDTFISRSYRHTLTDWQQNVRAVALGLEALRQVSRYGIGTRGEQYTGWAAIGTGRPMGSRAAEWTDERACEVLGLRGPYSESDIERARRELAKIHHPDRGGDASRMVEINAAADHLLSPP